MKLTIAGASPSCPNPGGASAGYLFSGSGGRFLLDCGHGIAGAVQTYLPLDDLSAIVISHMHPDHFLDLLPLRYGLQFYGVERLPLHLPPNGRDMLNGIEPALGLPVGFFADRYDISEYQVDSSLSVAGLELTFFPTQHFIPAYAVRVSDGPHSLFFSADTGPNQGVVDFARGADLGLVEATYETEDEDVEHPGHMSGTQAGALAREAQVGRLLLTHYWIPYAETVLSEAREAFAGQVDLAEQGATYTL